jgi:cell wall-associated NlpC family hydrolase
MHTVFSSNSLLSRVLICTLVFFLVTLPLPAAVCKAAAESVPAPGLEQQTDSKKVEILSDHKKKSIATTATNGKEAAPSAANGDTVANGGHNKAAAVGAKTAPTPAHKTATAPETAPPETEEGLSTLAKVGIGAGVVAVVGGIALAAGGSSDSGPRYPEVDDIVGKWSAVGITPHYDSSYRGAYLFSADGTHIYDIVNNDGTRKRGTGTWHLTEKSNNFVVHNDHGTTYIGDFQEEIFTTIKMTGVGGVWEVTLTKL